MSFEIKGKVIAVLDKKSGVSKSTGSPWSLQGYVIETQEQYPKKCYFEVFGEDRINQFAIQMDEDLTVSFDIDAREYQGRWYNSHRAWKVERNQPQPIAPAQGMESETNDLDYLFSTTPDKVQDPNDPFGSPIPTSDPSPF